MLDSGTLVGEFYIIERFIGSGGMGEVYLARDRQRGQAYAIKSIQSNESKANDKLFQTQLTAERDILLRLSNPHLPRIYAVIDQPEGYLLVMDYVEGTDLDSMVRHTGAQTPQTVCKWGIQICEVLDYLHRQLPPIIYRDLKPANVILQPNGNIKLIDFGTARTLKDNQKMSSDTVCVGTVGFAAPEQYGGLGQSDARTDIFCLGATLYNLITGHSPCEEPKGFCPLETFNPSLAGTPIDFIIARCVHPIPAMRYQTAQDLSSDLESALHGDAIFWTKVQGRQKSVWREQQIKSGGLSGLLRGGKSALLRRAETGGLSQAIQTARQSPQSQPQQLQQSQLSSPAGHATGTLNDGGGKRSRWWLPMVAGLLTTAVFFTLSIIFLLLGGKSPAMVALGVTIFGVILSAVSMFFNFRSQNQGQKPKPR